MSAVEPNDILDFLKILVSPDRTAAPTNETGQTKDAQPVNPFDQSLNNNLSAFWEKLKSGNYERLETLILQTKERKFSDASFTSSRWKFVQTCLVLLYSLQTSLERKQSELERKQENKEMKPNSAPPLSPDSFSVAQQKTLLTTLQFIIVLGIAPNLQPGVGIPIERRSEFFKSVSGSDVEGFSLEGKKYCLLSCVKTFMVCIKSPSLGALILSRHLHDLLAALLQLIHGYGAKTSTSATKRGVNSEGGNGSVREGQGHIEKGNGSVEDSSKWTPASVVDMVTRNNKSEVCESLTSPEQSVPSTNNSSLHTEERTTTEVITDENAASQTSHDVDKMTLHTSSADLLFCENSLKELLQRVYQPMLVRELLMLQGGPGPTMLNKDKTCKPSLQRAPKWLRQVCGRILTDILMKPKGVLNVLLGMLESSSGKAGTILSSKAADWRKCDAVAKVIACCPMQSSSVEEYYRRVAPQVVDLLHYKDKKITQELLRVTCSTITNLSHQHPHLSEKYLLQPLLQPLLSSTQENDIELQENQVIIVGEKELCVCVEDIHKVFVSGLEPASFMLQYLLPICQPLFLLYCHTKKGVSYLRSACQEILVTVLKHLDKSVSLCVLKFLGLDVMGESIIGQVQKLHDNVVYAPGSGGGVVIVTRSEQSLDPSQQEIEEAMVDLLKDLQKDGLAGDFLLYMLQSLTTIISEEVAPTSYSTDTKSSPGPTGNDLLDIEEKQERLVKTFRNKLMVLNLTATMCEAIGPSCLQDTSQTLLFIKVTLERAIQVCRDTEDELTNVFESETLTMALGLLTAVLSGGVKVSSSDRKEMKDLMPLLEKISNEHSDPSVQEMTSDLRIAIATHGAVWSERMKTSTSSEERKAKQNVKPKQPTESKKSGAGDRKPLIQVLSNHGDDTSGTGSDANTTSTQRQKQSQLKKSNSNESSHDSRNIGTDKLNQKPSEINKTSSSNVSESKSELQQAFEELCDPLVPVQGHALITLCKLLKRKDSDVMEKQETILKVFEENLNHSDSYIYLASVNGLVAMANTFPDMVIPRLTQEFVGFNVSEKNKNRGSETRMKIGECLVQTSRNLGDLSPKYRDVIVSAILTGTKDIDPFVRASSMANLGEICKVLKFSLGNIIHEVFTCCSSLLKSDEDENVRKASAAMITLLLQGLGENAIKVLDSLMKDLYHLLKLTLTTEKDELVQYKIQEAYNELDTIMRGVLFPKQTLQKKIRVLDPE